MNYLCILSQRKRFVYIYIKYVINLYKHYKIRFFIHCLEDRHISFPDNERN